MNFPSFFNFSKKLLIFAFAAVISLVFLLVLPLYQYYVRGSDLEKSGSKKDSIVAVPISLSQKPKKVKKLRVRSKKPKIAQSATRSDRFNLDLSASGGTGVAMGVGDTADIIYDQGQVDSLPVRVRGRAPEVPRSFSISGQRGLVELELIIEVDGKVGKVSVSKEEPKGYGLAEVAIKAVRTWKFRPALLNGIPVRLRVTQPFGF